MMCDSFINPLILCLNCRWVVLFSHPSDFTPVCTTELGRIAVHKEHFCKRNVKLLAHSVDDLQSHVDWVNVGFYFKIRLSFLSRLHQCHHAIELT